jgi:hypothetical protein
METETGALAGTAIAAADGAATMMATGPDAGAAAMAEIAAVGAKTQPRRHNAAWRRL